jgi:hypothetical protein
MALPITFNNQTYGAGFLGIDDGGASAGFSVDAASTYSVSVNGTVNAVGDTVTRRADGLCGSVHSADFDAVRQREPDPVHQQGHPSR